MVSENAETSINNLHDFTPAVGLTNPNLQTIFSSAIRKIIIPRTEADFLKAGQEEIINLGNVRLQIERDKPANKEPLGLIMINSRLAGTFQIELCSFSSQETSRFKI